MIPLQLTVFFMIIYVLESLTIIVQNGLLVAELSREWMQFQRLSPVDTILTCLGTCRFCLQWASLLYNLCSYFKPIYIYWYLSITWEFMNTLSFWLTSLLAVVYCVKVSSLTHPIFLWLRNKILRFIFRLLLGTLLISCVSVVPSAITNYIRSQMTMRYISTNNTEIERLEKFQKYLYLSHHMIALIIPFVIFLASIILLMASLLQHMEKIQHHTSHGSDSLKAHSTALRSLTVFVICFTFYLLVILISFISRLFDKSWFWVWEVVIYAIVSLHSASLILSHPKFKKGLK